MNKKEITFPFCLISRRAVMMTQTVQELITKPFFIEKNSRRVSAKSLLGLLSLGIKENDKVTLVSVNKEDIYKMEEIIKNL